MPIDEDPSRRPRAHAARRLEALSDIVFGLAMTFLASQLPLPAAGGPAPTWHDLAVRVGPGLSALGLSFAIAALYWFGQHRRLAQAATPTPIEIVLNFAFLLVVMLLPTSTELYERFGDRGSTVSIYSAHLALLSGLNALLWVGTIARSRQPGHPGLSWAQAAAPGFVHLILLGAALLALRDPGLAQNVLWLAFLGPVVARIAAGRPG